MNKESKAFIAAFLLPALSLYALFVIGPLISSILYSLREWNGVGEGKFIWLQNYSKMLAKNNFWLSFRNTAAMVVSSVLLQVPLGVILAYLLFRGTRGYKIYRAVIFLPVVISPVAVGIMFKLFYNSEIGLLNNLLNVLSLENLQREWLSDPDILLAMVIAPQVWQYIGLYVVIIFASLQSIPEQIFESAAIDGASSLRIFTKITLPLISEVMALGVILCVTGSMKAFEHPWIMTQGGPGFRSSYLTLYMYRTAFFERKFGYGSAVAITIILLSLVFTVIYNRLTSGSREEWT